MNEEESGWGPWSVEEAVIQWAGSIDVPLPKMDDIPQQGEDVAPEELRRLLRRFGAALVYLRAQQGILQGRIHGYKQSYESGLSALKGLAIAEKELPRTAAEAAKESWALNHPVHGETLRNAHRAQIELEAIAIAQKGIIDAYQTGWETVSRLISALGIDVELNRGS